MTRDEAIEYLLTIEEEYVLRGGNTLRDILLNGFKGFNNMTDDELFAEAKDAGIDDE